MWRMPRVRKCDWRPDRLFSSESRLADEPKSHVELSRVKSSGNVILKQPWLQTQNALLTRLFPREPSDESFLAIISAVGETDLEFSSKEVANSGQRYVVGCQKN